MLAVCGRGVFATACAIVACEGDPGPATTAAPPSALLASTQESKVKHPLELEAERIHRERQEIRDSYMAVKKRLKALVADDHASRVDLERQLEALRERAVTASAEGGRPSNRRQTFNRVHRPPRGQCVRSHAALFFSQMDQHAGLGTFPRQAHERGHTL